MARPSIVKGTYINVAVEEPVNSGTFVNLCGLTTKNFTQQKNASDVFVPDCNDPEDVPVRYLNVTGMQWDMSGDGLYNRAQAPLLRTLIRESTSRLFRFIVGEPASESVDDGYYEGPGQLMNLQLGGPAGGEYSTLSTAVSSDGDWDWTDAA